MTIMVSIRDAMHRAAELVRLAEQGERVVVTHDGKPVFDLVPHREKGEISLEAGEKFLRQKGISEVFPYVAADFDEPLPEDFLLRPLP